MIATCDVCGKGPVPCVHIHHSHCGETVQCYICAGDDFDPYDEMVEVTDIKMPSGHRAPHVLAVAGIRMYVDERCNEHGHSVFRYFVPTSDWAAFTTS